MHALVVSKDDEWHGIMLSGVPQPAAPRPGASVRQAFHRYESLLIPNEVMIERVAAEHAAIAACLEAGDVVAAQRPSRPTGSTACVASWTTPRAPTSPPDRTVE